MKYYILYLLMSYVNVTDAMWTAFVTNQTQCDIKLFPEKLKAADLSSNKAPQLRCLTSFKGFVPD